MLYFMKRIYQTKRQPDVACLFTLCPFLSILSIYPSRVFLSLLRSFFLLFPSLPPPSSLPSHPFFPVTKLAVSLSICWFFLQRPCTCSHLLSCWPPLLCPPPLSLSFTLSLPPSLLSAMLPGPFLAQLASLSFNPSVGKSTLFTAGGPSLFSSSRSAKAPPPPPRSAASQLCPKNRKLQMLH